MTIASDLFAGVLTSAVLSASGEEVQSAVVDDMVARLNSDGDLNSQIARSRIAHKESGDFGMEIASALLIPVLIEAAKGLWAAYVKKLGEQVGGQLADLTYKQAAKLVHWLWTEEERDRIEFDFEALLRNAASRHGLSSEQVEALIIAARSPEIRAALELQAKV